MNTTPELIRRDVLIAVRYACAPLPAQSLVLKTFDGSGSPLPLRSYPVSLPRWMGP